MSLNKEVRLNIPLRAVPLNQAYGTNKFGSFYKKKKAKDFQAEVLKMIQEQTDVFFEKDIELAATIRAYYTSFRNIDVDACLKLILDTLENSIMVNDSQIYELNVFKELGCEEDHIEIEVRSTGKIKKRKK